VPETFWSEIGEPTNDQPRYSQIYNPTLRVLNRWIAHHLNPRSDTRAVNRMDRAYLFAMVRKIEVNPTYFLINHWLEIAFTTDTPISFTPSITRIAAHIDLLEGRNVAYVPTAPLLGEEFFRRAHLCRRDGDVIYMRYPGHDAEVALPHPQLSIYSGNSLRIRLQDPQPARRGEAGVRPRTRQQARMEAKAAAP
jgi:hypothetical protein